MTRDDYECPECGECAVTVHVAVETYNVPGGPSREIGASAQEAECAECGRSWHGPELDRLPFVEEAEEACVEDVMDWYEES